MSPSFQSLRTTRAASSNCNSQRLPILPFLSAICCRKWVVSRKSGNPKTSRSLSLSQRCNMSSTGAMGSSRDSILMAFRKTQAAVSASFAENTIPGQSMTVTLEFNCTSDECLVKPGVLPTATTVVRLRALMTLDLPTFGYPITPTMMRFLPPSGVRAYPFKSLCRQSIHLLVMAPLRLVKATTGSCSRSSASHSSATSRGTKSTLLRINKNFFLS
mmetsp:Transcript_1270/g.2101  ORF Transcript_1270/g.2101 Transcript_1270/m.2101 type:complete len:216 (-) Transcript_1270:406-1053(-)